MRLVPLLLLLCLAACARPSQPAPPDCADLYTILPGNFIIDLAAGSHVLINPALEQFPLYCRPEQAQAALRKANLPGDWRIYKLKGGFTELAETTGSGQYRLAVPAEVEDWVE